ncbi:MAG: uracil-DNA glycosylase family protein [Pseudomonadota bacterium]
MQAIESQVRDCTQCTDLPLGPRPLFQVSGSAKVLIAGQAPGRVTHQKGVHFDDASGDRLRDWLGLSRDVFYDADRVAILPMGFCYPGTGPGGDLPPRPACAAAWCQPLLDALASVELTVIIGRYAIDWHRPDCAKATVTEAVRSWESAWPRQIVLPHPSPRNNRWLKANPWFSRNVLPSLQRRVRELT